MPTIDHHREPALTLDDRAIGEVAREIFATAHEQRVREIIRDAAPRLARALLRLLEQQGGRPIITAGRAHAGR